MTVDVLYIEHTATHVHITSGWRQRDDIVNKQNGSRLVLADANVKVTAYITRHPVLMTTQCADWIERRFSYLIG